MKSNQIETVTLQTKKRLKLDSTLGKRSALSRNCTQIKVVT